MTRMCSLLGRPRRRFGAAAARLAAAVTVAAAFAAVPAPRPAGAQQCLYFTNQVLGSVRFIDPQNLAQLNPLVGEIRRAECPPGTTTCQPLALAFNNDQSEIYYTDVAAGGLSVIDVASNQVVRTILVGTSPRDVAVSAAGVVYVTIFATDEVAVVDPDAGSVLDRIAVGNQPRGVAFSPNGSIAYVAVTGPPGEVDVIDVEQGEVVDTVAVDEGPFGVAVAGDGTVYVTCPNGREVPGGPRQPTVSVIATPANEVVDTIDVATGPAGIAVSPDDSEVYVANLNVNRVSVIDTTSNAVVAGLTVGMNPIAVTFDAAGANAYVANVGNVSNNVSMIDTSDRSVLNSSPIGAGINDLVVGEFACAVIPTPTATPTFTPVPTGTSTPTSTGTATPDDTDTPGPSPTPTLTPTTNPSLTATPTPTSPDGTVTATPTGTPGTDCVGDCNEDGTVSADELVRGVNIGLGRFPLSVCPSLDVEGDGVVSVVDLIDAVAAATGPCA